MTGMRPGKYLFWVVIFGVGVLSAYLSAEESLFSSMRVRVTEGPQQVWQQSAFHAPAFQNEVVAVRQKQRQTSVETVGTSFAAMSQRMYDESNYKNLAMN